MKKEFDLEIKKMLSLFESKSGDVRPITRRSRRERILSEANVKSITPITRREMILSEEEGEPIDRLEQLERNFESILQKDKGSNAQMIQKWSKLDTRIYDKIEKTCDEKGKINPFQIGDRYAMVKFAAPNGRLTDYLVFGIEGPKPNTLFGVQLSDPTGEDRGYTEYLPVLISFPSMDEYIKSRTEDVLNFSGPQWALIKRLTGSTGTNQTSYVFTVKTPTGDEKHNWIAVDLATGEGENGVQYIPKTLLNPSEVYTLFPEAKKRCKLSLGEIYC